MKTKLTLTVQKEVIGIAISGSYEGFEVIQEV